MPPKPTRPKEQPTYKYPSGDRYTGQWLNGRKHGHGVAEFVSGNRYEGEWDNDFKHGKGTITFVDGTTYSGDWCKDHKHGYGIAKFASGNRYEGQWVDDAMEGQGTFYYARGDVYSGEWKRGKISGYGTWVSFDQSSQYQGYWQDGLRHGRGLLSEGGRECQVEYRNGTRLDSAPPPPPPPPQLAPPPLETTLAASVDQSSMTGQATPRSDADVPPESPRVSVEVPKPKAKKKKKDKPPPDELTEGGSVYNVPSPEGNGKTKRKKHHQRLSENAPTQAPETDPQRSAFLPTLGKAPTGTWSLGAPPLGPPPTANPHSPASVTPVPRARLPPLSGAPKIPMIDKDATYRRRPSAGGSARKDPSLRRPQLNSSLMAEELLGGNV